MSYSSSILECKYNTEYNIQSLFRVIVAPYWNVNNFLFVVIKFYHFVIVAPYWNVNWLKDLSLDVDDEVIVAPYWNVNNGLYTLVSQLLQGYSSSILECKSFN